ncbi:MAG: hypothetical protein JKY71_06065 [Alphaproteobacteria bacterium]|nr:hypothetical protein [Alphaproteobacteria bacterium]
MAAPAAKEHFFSAANLAWAAIGIGLGFYLEAWAITPGGQEFFAGMAEKFGMITPLAAAPGVNEVALSAAETADLGFTAGESIISF